MKLLLALAFVATASALTCNTYTRTSATADAASTVATCTSGFNRCMTYGFTGTANVQSALSTGYTGVSDWTCSMCETDNCNAVSTPGGSSSVGRTAGFSVAALMVALLAYFHA